MDNIIYFDNDSNDRDPNHIENNFIINYNESQKRDRDEENQNERKNKENRRYH